jgi:hypothetical protein
MLRFGSSADVLLSATSRPIFVSLPCSEASRLLRHRLLHLKLMSVYYPAIYEWHATSVRPSLLGHDELPIDSHFEFRRVDPAALNHIVVPHDYYVSDARCATIICDRSIL